MNVNRCPFRVQAQMNSPLLEWGRHHPSMTVPIGKGMNEVVLCVSKHLVHDARYDSPVAAKLYL